MQFSRKCVIGDIVSASEQRRGSDRRVGVQCAIAGARGVAGPLLARLDASTTTRGS